jgi:protocatechuate 3,4-dioxygenase beta subunit
MRYSVFVALLACTALIIPSTAGATAGSGAIQGKVTEASSPHSPLAHVSVRVFPAGTEFAPGGFAETNAQGEYTVEGLDPGLYYVEFRPAFEANFVVQFWEDKSSVALATPLAIENSGQVRTGIDAELEEGGVVEGTVTDASGQPVAEGGVAAWLSGADLFEPNGEALTSSDGKYRIVGLATGTYRVLYQPPGLPHPPLNLVAQERTLPVKVKQTTESNVTLPTGGEISGRVIDAVTHDPVVDAIVNAYAPGGEAGGFGFSLSNGNGDYTVVGLASGTYELEVSGLGESVYITQFDTGIDVTQGSTTPGVDISLVPQAPNNIGAPVASGTPAVGQALSCSNGSWSGILPISYSYKWLRDGSTIEGATGSSYTVQSADQGHGVACEVTATNSKGHSSAKSNTLSVPLPPPLPPPPPVPSVALASAKVLVTGDVARVPIHCNAASCTGTIELVQQIVTKHHRGHRTITRKLTIVLGEASYTLAAGQTRLLVVHLSKSGKHRLDATRHHELSISLLVSVQGGSQLRQPVLLEQARVKRK